VTPGSETGIAAQLRATNVTHDAGANRRARGRRRNRCSTALAGIVGGVRIVTPTGRCAVGRGALILVWGLLAMLPDAPAWASPPRGVFVTRCTFSHSLRDDPIMFPGEAGASHRHEFFGSSRTNATSTRRRMIAGPTTCSIAVDTAAYWFPQDSVAAPVCDRLSRRRTTSVSPSSRCWCPARIEADRWQPIRILCGGQPPRDVVVRCEWTTPNADRGPSV
jgi:hypothetical protein